MTVREMTEFLREQYGIESQSDFLKAFGSMEKIRIGLFQTKEEGHGRSTSSRSRRSPVVGRNVGRSSDLGSGVRRQQAVR